MKGPLRMIDFDQRHRGVRERQTENERMEWDTDPRMADAIKISCILRHQGRTTPTLAGNARTDVVGMRSSLSQRGDVLA
jgi:hypothetical protein